MRIPHASLAVLFLLSIVISEASGRNIEKADRDSLSESERKNIIHFEKDYPNPFCAKTVVSFTMERKDRVKVGIFDIRGKSHGIILETFIEAGKHTITPDLKDLDLTSGVYFIRISNSDTSAIWRMTLLK